MARWNDNTIDSETTQIGWPDCFSNLSTVAGFVNGDETLI